MNLAQIFADTMTKCNTLYLSETQDLVEHGIRFYTEEIDEPQFTERDMKIEVVNEGTVSAGKRIAEQTKKRTAILNFADAIRPGGWVIDGAPTQEENICRCSNLYPVLISSEPFEKYYWVNAHTLYPKLTNMYGDDIPVESGAKWEDLNPYHAIYTHRLFYSRDVLFFKNDTTYEDEKPYPLDVITCPSPAVFWKDENYGYTIIFDRAKQIVKSAILNGADNLILGAWGCGAFGQNPNTVSTAFKAVLEEYPAFDNVIFAVRDTSENWKSGNFKVFLDNIKGV